MQKLKCKYQNYNAKFKIDEYNNFVLNNFIFLIVILHFDF